MDTPNYKENTVQGTEWIRCNEVNIFNPHGGVPYMLLKEELIFVSSDETKKTTQQIGQLMVSFDINNPLHLQMYTICNAIYIEEREKRDNPPPVIPEEPVI